MKFQRIEGIHAPVELAISDVGPTMPFDSALKVDDKIVYFSKREREILGRALMGERTSGDPVTVILDLTLMVDMETGDDLEMALNDPHLAFDIPDDFIVDNMRVVDPRSQEVIGYEIEVGHRDPYGVAYGGTTQARKDNP